MTIKKKPSAADLLTRLINPKATEPELEWYDLPIEIERRHQEFLSDREANRQTTLKAERRAALSTPDLIRSTLAGMKQQDTMPLNGTRVLKAALAGGHGTINSPSRKASPG